MSNYHNSSIEELNIYFWESYDINFTLLYILSQLPVHCKRQCNWYGEGERNKWKKDQFFNIHQIFRLILVRYTIQLRLLPHIARVTTLVSKVKQEKEEGKLCCAKI